ncbi:MAG: hypothetical protein Q3979_05565 [Actinomycetaceae bacterium]|nr:hypothetical protein [Actinomycetaceae bacterium]
MADTTTAPTQDAAAASATPETGTPADGDQLGEAGKRALDREREAHKAAAKRAAAAEAKLRELEDAGKTEAQKQAEELQRAKAELAEAKALASRLTVAADTGIPAGILAGPGDDMDAWVKALLDWKGEAAAVQDNAGTTAGEPVPSLGHQPQPAGNVSIDAQIAAAEKAGDATLAKSLKAMMLGRMPAASN